MTRAWSVLRASLAGLGLIAALGAATAARAEGAYGPERAAKTMSSIRLGCAIIIRCPIDSKDYDLLRRALSGDRDAQFDIAKLLDVGEGIPRDRRAALGWYGKAAELGHIRAALELNYRRHQGDAIEADEGKIAAALRREAEAGDGDAMRALADMYIYGRGVPRDPQEALKLLRRAREGGSAAAEQDLASLFLLGAPGVPENHSEALRWMVASGRRGNIDAMGQLGSLYFHIPDSALRDPVEGYRWLMRAALLDDPRSQEALSTVLAEGAMTDGRAVIAPDPVQADMWFRLGARSPYHDNPSIRLRVESSMTSAQLNEAKKLAADWHPRALGEVLAMTIDPPPVPASAKRPLPSGLIGPARQQFADAGDNAEPWQRLPDFDRPEEVAAAMTAIAAHCESKGLEGCATFCRDRLAELAPPEKPGGLSPQEVAERLSKNPKLSPIALMRKTPPTAEEQSRTWTLCALRVADH